MSVFFVQLIITLVVASLNILLGLLIYMKNPKSITHKLLGVIALIVALWAITNLYSLNSQDSLYWTLFWIKAVMVITSWLGPVMIIFVKSYPRSEVMMSKVWVTVILVYAAITSSLGATPLMFSDVSIKDGNITPTPGPAILLFAIGFVGMIFASLIMLLVKYIKAKGKEKIQMFYLLLGMILTFGFMVFANFIVVILFKSSALVFLGPSASILMIGFVSYAIVKHRFLDLKLIIFRAVSFSILLVAATLMYVAGVVSIGGYLFDIQLDTHALIFVVVTNFLLAWSFPYLRRVIESFTSPIFFKDTYDEGLLLKKITTIISSTIVLDKLVVDVFRQLFEEMGVNGAFAAVYEDGKKVWTHAFRYNDSGIDPVKLKQLARDLMKTSDELIYIFEELTDEHLKDVFRRYNITVLLPLIVKKELVGVVLLGDKASGEVYSSRDIEVLKIVAPELAIGIKNATAYQQIEDFNSVLKEEVRKATADLRSANKRLLELDARKDEFISIASHELRTPLTAVKNYLWMTLNNSPKPLPEEVKNDLNICAGSVEHLIHLVNDMLTVSRIESNKIDLQAKPMDIVDLMKTLIDELKINAQTRGIALTLDTDTDRQLLNGDQNKLREVFQNIIGNAIKFVPDKGSVKVNVQAHKDEVRIAIADNGPGIRKEDMDRLFSKFGKIDYAYKKTRSVSGTGLGLYICKRIVDLHKGEIEVESKLGKGTTFIVTLPVHTR